MNPGVIISYTIESVICTFILVSLSVLLVRNKGSWFKLENCRDKEWAIRHRWHIRAACVACTVMGLVAVFSVNIPMIKDIPHILGGEYLAAEGVVLYDSLGGAPGRVQQRSFAIVDESTGEEIHGLETLSTELRKGEYVEVTYLPNSHLATISHREGR